MSSTQAPAVLIQRRPPHGCGGLLHASLSADSIFGCSLDSECDSQDNSASLPQFVSEKAHGSSQVLDFLRMSSGELPTTMPCTWSEVNEDMPTPALDMHSHSPPLLWCLQDCPSISEEREHQYNLSSCASCSSQHNQATSVPEVAHGGNFVGHILSLMALDDLDSVKPQPDGSLETSLE